jgi:hypothetical protein
MTDLDYFHDYDEKDSTKCKKCNDIFKLHGETHAQINEPHYFESIVEPSKSKYEPIAIKSSLFYKTPVKRELNTNKNHIPIIKLKPQEETYDYINEDELYSIINIDSFESENELDPG